jgi:hypothetical protein
LKSLLDANGDGGFGLEDIQSLSEGGPLESLTNLADQNQDGSLGLEDITGEGGGVIDSIKNNLL